MRKKKDRKKGRKEGRKEEGKERRKEERGSVSDLKGTKNTASSSVSGVSNHG